MLQTINRGEIKKTLKKMLGKNIPIPAVLVACCFIDALTKIQGRKERGCSRFVRYVKEKMPETYRQFEENDKIKKVQINRVDCSVHDKHKCPCKCKTSCGIFYHHIRCGLIHNYFSYIDNIKLINRRNEKYRNIIVDFGSEKKKFALVLNAPVFVGMFINSLQTHNKF